MYNVLLISVTYKAINSTTDNNMSREISNIMDINLNMNKKWTVIVQVMETGHIQQSNAGDEFRRLLFIDSKGTKVAALIYTNHLKYFKNTFKLYKRYYISNANLMETKPHFCVSSYELSWSLNKNTLIKEYVEDIPPILPCEFHFTPFKDLHKYAESENLQNVRDMVIKCFPSQQVDTESGPTTRRDVVIVNEEKKLMKLTLWNHFAEHEGYMLQKSSNETSMIFGMQVKVTTFNGLSLTTRGASAMLINPPVTENLQLQTWYKDHKTEILQLLKKETYKNGELLLPYPDEKYIIPITEAIASSETVKSKTAWVKGKVTLPSQDKTFSHTGCANCLKTIDADITWIVTCPSCKLDSEVIPISRATVEINDGTGIIRGTISTPDIEKFIPFTPNQLKDAEEFGKNVHDAIATSIHSMSAVAFVRSYKTTFNRQPSIKFSIVKAHRVKKNSLTELLPNPQTRKRKEPVTSTPQDIKTSEPTSPSTTNKTV